MKRSDLRAMIQQEISKMKEDLLVSPEDVPDNFKRDPSVDVSPHPSSGCEDDPYDSEPSGQDYSIPKTVSKMSLTCSSCGDPLVMEGGCGCSAGPEMSFSNYEPDLVYADMSISGHSQQHHKEGSYMAKSQLHKIKEYSEKLQHMIPEDYELDDWMRSHISQASDDIGEVYHKLDYMFSKE